MHRVFIDFQMNAEYYRARNDVSKFRTKIEELFVGETVFARFVSFLFDRINISVVEED